MSTEEYKEVITKNFILFGGSGSGKTSFVKNMGSETAEPNHTMKSGTKYPKLYTIKVGNTIYNYIDTVGLNDTGTITDELILSNMDKFVKVTINYVNALIIIYDGSKKLGPTVRKSYKKIFDMFDDEKLEVSLKKIMFVTHVEQFHSEMKKKKLTEIKNDSLFSDVDEIHTFNGCSIEMMNRNMAQIMQPIIITESHKTLKILNRCKDNSLESEIMEFRNQFKSDQKIERSMCAIL